MLRLMIQGLVGRPLRLGLTLLGVAVAVGVWAALESFGDAYRQGMRVELDRAGIQMMLVPLGCPYDAAARVLKGRTLETSLPWSAVETARKDPAVAEAAPFLMASVDRPSERRTDLWVGMDESGRRLKPWWKAARGTDWFADTRSVILGSELAATELRSPGDAYYSPGLGATFRVEGVLERSGTADDSLAFIPLERAMALVSTNRHVTAVAIRLRDPSLSTEASARLQEIPGAQVVTMTEMMGTFVNLVSTVRTLLSAISLLAIATGLLGVMNTMATSVAERTPELCLFRAIGALPRQLFALVAMESVAVCTLGAVLGLTLAVFGAPWLTAWVQDWVPMAPEGLSPRPSAMLCLRDLGIAAVAGLLVSIWPAWRASRLPPALGGGES